MTDERSEVPYAEAAARFNGAKAILFALIGDADRAAFFAKIAARYAAEKKEHADKEYA